MPKKGGIIMVAFASDKITGGLRAAPPMGAGGLASAS